MACAALPPFLLSTICSGLPTASRGPAGILAATSRRSSSERQDPACEPAAASTHLNGAIRPRRCVSFSVTLTGGVKEVCRAVDGEGGCVWEIS